MIVRLFYNKSGVGDVLLVRMSNQNVTSMTKEDDLVVLFDAQQQMVGMNVFRASEKFTALMDQGYFYSPQMIDELNQYLCDNQKQELNVDVLSRIVVGDIVSCVPHPHSDHLFVTKVKVMEEELQIVCGANNVGNNQKVVVAKVGAVLPDGTMLDANKLLGIDSYGMLCSYRELRIPVEQSGIIVLDDSYQNGAAFHWKG